MLRLPTPGLNVLQTDTDVVWFTDPYPALYSHPLAQQALVIQKDLPFANAGVIYARGGAGSGSAWALHELQACTLSSPHPAQLVHTPPPPPPPPPPPSPQPRPRPPPLLPKPTPAPPRQARIATFSFHPEAVPRLVPWARPPYFSNADEQTLLNDVHAGLQPCIASAVTRCTQAATLRAHPGARLRDLTPPLLRLRHRHDGSQGGRRQARGSLG